jgi:hypothetical protein
MPVCASCGKEYVAGTKFCVGCGAPLPAAPPPAPSSAPGCPNCGAPSTGSKFCVRCGAAMGGDVTATPLTQPPAPPSPPEPEKTQAKPPAPVAAPEATAPSPAPPARKGKAGLIIGIVLGAAVLGAGGWYGYEQWQTRRAAAPEAPQQAQTEAPAPAPTTPVPVPTPAESAVPPAAAVPAPAAATPAPARPAPERKPAPAPVRQAAPPAQPKPEPAPAAQPVQAAPPPAAPAQAAQEQAAPVQTAPPQRAPAQITPPSRPAPAPGYTGPTSGVVIWSGQLEKGGTITLDGATASQGTLNGSLPGVPVMIQIEPADVAVAEAPAPSNGWKRAVLRSRRNQHSVVTIRWKVL